TIITGCPAGACHRAGQTPDPLAGHDSRWIEPLFEMCACCSVQGESQMIRLPIGALALLFVLSPVAAPAQDWPTKQPIKVIVPFTAGSATDIAGRIVFDQVGK